MANYRGTYDKGICFVFDHRRFENNLFTDGGDSPNRNGSQIDKDKIKEAFAYLNFVVKEYTNENKERILKIIDDFNGTNCEFDCIVIFLLTHSKQNRIAARDQFYSLQEITAILKSFSGPKLIFLNSSGQVNIEAQDLRLNTSALERDGNINLHDFVVAACSMSIPKKFTGTAVIQTVVDVVRENEYRDFRHLIDLVNARRPPNSRISVINIGSSTRNIVKLMETLERCDSELNRISQHFEYNLLSKKEIDELEKKGVPKKYPQFMAPVYYSLSTQQKFIFLTKAEIDRRGSMEEVKLSEKLQQLMQRITNLLQMWENSTFLKTTKIYCICIDNLDCVEDSSGKELVSLEMVEDDWRRVIRKCVTKTGLRSNDIIPFIRSLVAAHCLLKQSHPSDLIPQNLELNIYAHCGIDKAGDGTQRNYILGENKEKLYLENIVEMVSKFKHFKNVFLNLNSCKDYVRTTQQEYIVPCDRKLTTKILKKVLIGWSTINAHASWRHMDLGSYFITQLCKNIREHSDESLLKIVRRIEIEIEKYIQITEFQAIGFEREFKLNRVKHGKCVIINIKNFEPNLWQETRHGSEKDVEKLEQLFEQLNFDVESHSDVTMTQILEIIKNSRTADCDAFVLIVMSHGDNNSSGKHSIFTHDGCLPTEEIIEMFNDDDCAELKEVPKMLIFNACRGTKVAVQLENEGYKDGSRESVINNGASPILCDALGYSHPLRDMVIVWSTIAGYDNTYYSSDSQKLDRLINAFNKVCITFNYIDGGVEDFFDILHISQSTMQCDQDTMFEHPIEVNTVGLRKLLNFGFNQTAQSIGDSYTMDRNENGHCLVIAAENDISQYEATLSSISQILRFNLVIERNLTAKEIYKTIEEYAKNDTLLNHKAFMLILLTDGKRQSTTDFIIGNDGDLVAIDEIRYIFNEKEAPLLAGKPKIIFTAAPRGDKYYVNNTAEEKRRYKLIDLICDENVKFRQVRESPNISIQLNTPFGLIIKVGFHYVDYGSSAKLTLPLAFKRKPNPVPIHEDNEENAIGFVQEDTKEIHVLNHSMIFENYKKLSNILRAENRIHEVIFHANNDDRIIDPSDDNIYNGCFCGHCLF